MAYLVCGRGLDDRMLVDAAIGRTQALPVRGTVRFDQLDIGSLHRWAEAGNVFEETKSHGVRQLVTAPELLSPISN